MKPKKVVEKISAESKILNAPFAIQGIFVNNFHIRIPKITYDVRKCEITYNVSPLIKYKIQDDLALIKSELKGDIHETNEIILEAEVAFTSKVHDLNKLMTEVDKDKWDFIDQKNKGILTSLLSVSLSTLRGIVFERVKGTIMDGKFIPVVNPNIFFK